ncbi:ATP-dependent helicase [Patescibacteria group bacterium]
MDVSVIILALTFTESGAKAMRERLVEIIGPSAYYVNITTFHSFCTDVIKEFQEEFLISEDTTPLSDLERIQLFREILDSNSFEILKPTNSPYYYINDLIRAVQDLKREGISPIEFRNLIDDDKERINNIEKKVNPRTNKPYAKYAKEKRELTKQKELLTIFTQYQTQINKLNRFDFEDMINLVVDKLQSDKNFKLTLQERYLYVLIDEYQDTNSAQNQIVKLLTDHWESPNVFVVGDDEQSIYRFQGASLENIHYFKNLFKKANIITLTSNYRSSQYILDASRSLISKNLLKLKEIKKDLRSKIKRKNVPIKVAKFSNSDIENSYISSKIKELMKNKVDPDEIAILVRHNRDIDNLKDSLTRSNIRFEIATGKNILEEGDIKRLLLLLKVIHNLRVKPSNDIDFFTLLNFEFLNFDKLDILKLARFASVKRVNLIDAILNEDLFSEIKLNKPKKLIELTEKLNSWQKLSSNKTFVKFFETVIQESGFLNWILSDKLNISRINSVNTLFNEVKNLNYADHNLNLETFLANIELMEENNIKIEKQTCGEDTDAIKLLTAHKAKGLEFEYVFIAKCIDKKWGNNRQRASIKLPTKILSNVDIEKGEKNEDERRLFYVALTRAKKQIFITFSDRYTSDGFERQAIPSMFISEIDKGYLKEEDTKDFEKKFADNVVNQLKLPVSEKETLKEEDFLNSLLSNFKLSVTALNTYLKCHYKFKINNILRTPRAKPTYLAFGTAIHKAFEKFFRKFIKIKKPPQKLLLFKEFEKALEKELLDEKEFKETLQRGKKVLDEYYEKNKDRFTEPLYIEYSFGFRKVRLGDISLSGKIDKIEFVNKDKKEVKVIDYKTGTPKTRGEIEGKTKYSDGDLLRQLLFYKILSQLDRNFNYTVVKGEFDFVESKSGKGAKKEEYEYSDEQIENLKNTIRENMKQIYNLEFERTKEYRHCEKCDYKSHCWPDGIPRK